MTATDELRRMLDERGMDYRVSATGYSIDIGPYTTVYANRSDTTLDVSLREVTPEQAIEATLGRGTCKNVHEPPKDTTFWPTPHFKCSVCGKTHVSIDYVYFCPNCGRRVKVVDE